MTDSTSSFTPPPMPPSRNPGGGPGGGARRNTGAIVAAAIAALLVIVGAVVAVVMVNREDTIQRVAVAAVTLEPAADTGADPFLASVTITEVAEFPDSVMAVIDQTQSAMTTDAATGTLTTPGSVANIYGGRQDPAAVGLYGGSGEQTVCDVAQLADYLAGDEAKAKAWSGARGISPAQVGAYLQTLTPVALLSDTAVTNYGFAGGVATPRPAVLQAGTAVLVDFKGLPVVRCACGNPLSAPTMTNLPSAEFLGNRWESFDPARSVYVTDGGVTPAFTLVDLATGVSFERQVGAAPSSTSPASTSQAVAADGPRTIVVVDTISSGTGAATGQVSASTDGVNWVTVLSNPTALSGVAYGVGLTVVVGGDDSGGTIRSSTDGATWSEPVPVPEALQKVGFGNGTWLAVGAAADGAGEVAVVYTSPDAVTWTKSPAPTGITAESSITIGSVAYGQGKWQLSYGARAGTGRGFSPLGIASSPDGQNWQIVVQPGGVPAGYSAEPVAMDLAFGADQWAFVGYTVADVVADLSSRTSQSGTSADGTTWAVQQTALVDTYLDSLAWAGDGEWLARGGLKGGMTGAASDHAVYSSTDLVNWTRLGAPGSLIGDIAATRWSSIAPPAAPSSTAGTAAAPAACTDGGLEFRVSRETTFPTCEAMITQWRSFMATGGTETRQGDWICRLGTPAEPGSCALSDTDIFFTVVAAGSSGSGSTAAAPPTPAAPSAVTGDLSLTVPMTRPACDGTGIVVLFSAVTPGSYAQEVQAALDANPGSSYLRTDQSCSSLNQATADGNAIYAVYRVGGPDQNSVCAAVAGSGGYGKWLDNTSDPDARIEC